MAGVTDHFLKIFEMVGLSKYIKIYPPEEAAGIKVTKYFQEFTL